MGKFNIRGIDDAYIEVIDENNHDYLINIIKYNSGRDCDKQETMSKVIFDFCVSSGYFTR